MQLDSRIREIRKLKKISQAEVAYKMNICPSTYGDMERNATKCSWDTLQKIAHALGVTIQFLINTESNTDIK